MTNADAIKSNLATLQEEVEELEDCLSGGSLSVSCSLCPAEENESCVTTSGKKTDTHVVRKQTFEEQLDTERRRLASLRRKVSETKEQLEAQIEIKELVEGFEGLSNCHIEVVSKNPRGNGPHEVITTKNIPHITVGTTLEFGVVQALYQVHGLDVVVHSNLRATGPLLGLW